MTSASTAYAEAIQQVEAAVAEDRLTSAAAENIRSWLTESRYAEYAEEVARHIADGEWQQLDDVFWTVIPFGTGGRRGRMYPIGSNAINDRTIGESAQGLADYAKEVAGETSQPLSCAIAYDTRHRSPEFARLCAEVMAATGFKVYFLDGHRSTPELSFTVRHKGCACGIMVTASHNPPSDNAVKAYWSTGGQLLPPHDKQVIDRVMNVDRIERLDFGTAVEAGQIVCCQEEVDEAFQSAVLAQAIAGPRELAVIYSPLHGVGATAVCPVLARDGFSSVEIYAPHEEPNGDFPNVPGHVSNPENPRVFDAIVERARAVGADLVLATDPDCDRIGCAARLTPDHDAEWGAISGNQIGALLSDFLLEHRQAAGQLTSQHYLVETLVTTQLTRRIGDSYGVQTVGDLLVGFKWIAGVIDDQGPERFVFGTEESHGYLAGTHVRDKDGAVAAMLLCELAAQLKEQGQTLHQKLEALMWQHGAHAEHTFSVQMPGSEGMQRMQEVMASFRAQPPIEVAGQPVSQVRDYLQQTVTDTTGSSQPLSGPRGDLVILDLGDGNNFVAVRPSGTEPKIKFYMFTYRAPELLAELDLARQELADLMSAMEASLRAFAGV